jgi:hypothetical protein
MSAQLGEQRFDRVEHLALDSVWVKRLDEWCVHTYSSPDCHALVTNSRSFLTTSRAWA